VAAGEPIECFNPVVVMRAEALSRKEGHVLAQLPSAALVIPLEAISATSDPTPTLSSVYAALFSAKFCLDFPPRLSD
jgi:hypothetical protein